MLSAICSNWDQSRILIEYSIGYSFPFLEYILIFCLGDHASVGLGDRISVQALDISGYWYSAQSILRSGKLGQGFFQIIYN